MVQAVDLNEPKASEVQRQIVTSKVRLTGVFMSAVPPVLEVINKKRVKMDGLCRLVNTWIDDEWHEDLSYL